MPFALPRLGHVPRKAVLDDEVERRARAEQDEWVAVEAVAEPLEKRHGLVLLHGDGDDVAEGTQVQIARMRMMDRVRLAPVVIRGEAEHADHRSRDAGQSAGLEVRPMAAVVLEHEEPHHQAGRRQGEKQGEPVAHPKAPVHERPRRHEQDGRVAHLQRAAAVVRSKVGGEDLPPVANLLAVDLHAAHRRFSGAPYGYSWLRSTLS